MEANQPINMMDALHQMAAWVTEVEKRFDHLHRLTLAADGGNQWLNAFVATVHSIKMASAHAHLAAEQFVIASQALDVSLGELIKQLGPEVISQVIPEPPCKVTKLEDEGEGETQISKMN